MAELARSYAAIIKTDKNPDGTLRVYGKATDDSIDRDNQICDENWLRKAMPDWFETGGNIREQHSNIAAGVATDYELKSDGHYITALVVDPTSVKKVEAGVLKGFSIGIRSPRIVRDEKAVNGRIIDGQIVEVSLVDRPANPNAKMMLAKAVGNDLVAVEQDTALVIPTPGDVAKQFNKSEEPDGEVVADEPVVEETVVEDLPDVQESAKSDFASVVDNGLELLNVSSQLVGFLNKFDQTTYDAAVGAISDLIAVEAGEMKQGSDERQSIKELLHAIKHLFHWYEGEADEGEVSNPNPSIVDDVDSDDSGSTPDTLFLADSPEDKMCDKCNKSLDVCKCEDKSTVSDDTVSESANKEASTDSVEVEADTLKSALEAAEAKAAKLEAELAEAKALAISGGPKRAVLNKSISSDARDSLLARASELRAKAQATTDRVLAEGYNEWADDLEAKAGKGF